MDDFLRNLLLVFCGIGAIVLLIVTYLWYFVFAKSLRAVLMAGLSIMMNRDSKIDLDDDPKLVKRPEHAKKEMTQEVEAISFDASVNVQSEYVPQMAHEADGFGAQAAESSSKKNSLVSSSFEGGRFRRITKVLSRPFLNMRLNSVGDVVAENLKQGTDSSNTE